MNAALIIFKQNAIKFFLLLIISIPIMFFLNLGFSLNPQWKIFQVMIFSVTLAVIIILHKAKQVILITALFLIIVMVFLYILNFIEWAEMAGSTGVGFIIITILSYLPQLIKLGYIKKL